MSSHRVTPARLLPALPCGRRVSQLPRESRTPGLLFPLSRPPLPLPCHLHELGSHLRDPQALTWSLDFFLHKCVDSTGRSENRPCQLPSPALTPHTGPCLQLSAVKSLCPLSVFSQAGLWKPRNAHVSLWLWIPQLCSRLSDPSLTLSNPVGSMDHWVWRLYVTPLFLTSASRPFSLSPLSKISVDFHVIKLYKLLPLRAPASLDFLAPGS